MHLFVPHKVEVRRLELQLSIFVKLCEALRVGLSQLVGEKIKKGGTSHGADTAKR